MYVFWFSDFTLQNYFPIKRGNGQVGSENTVGNKVKKKQFFCQLDFWTAVKTVIAISCLCANLHETDLEMSSVGLIEPTPRLWLQSCMDHSLKSLMVHVGPFLLRIFCGSVISSEKAVNFFTVRFLVMYEW